MKNVKSSEISKVFGFTRKIFDNVLARFFFDEIADDYNDFQPTYQKDSFY